MELHLVPPCTCDLSPLAPTPIGSHHVSASCTGELCNLCAHAGEKQAATHKVGEEIAFDDPGPMRHNLTAYVCCACFRKIMGPAVPCRNGTPK